MGVTVREKVKGSGVFYIFVHHQGKRRSFQGGSEKEALEAAKIIEAKLTLKQYEKGSPEEAENQEPVTQEAILANTPPFKEYALMWLEDYIKAVRRATTYERYYGILITHVNPVIGKKPIGLITRGDIRNLLLNIRKKGYSKSQVCVVRDVLSGAMGYALDEEIIQSNPVAGVVKRLGLEPDKKGRVVPLTREEVALFLETCKKRRPEHFPFFFTAFRTGMRLGELLGLEWGDIDWNGKYIHVARAFKRGQVTKTKTGKDRNVDMSEQLIFVLRQLLKLRKEQALQNGLGEPVPIIFHNEEGGHRAQNSIRNVFKATLRKAGLREIRFHDCRHTYASLLLSDGASVTYVKEQLGHSSIQTTVDTYGHLIPGSNRGSVNKLDDPSFSCQNAPNTRPNRTQKNKRHVTN